MAVFRPSPYGPSLHKSNLSGTSQEYARLVNHTAIVQRQKRRRERDRSVARCLRGVPDRHKAGQDVGLAMLQGYSIGRLQGMNGLIVLIIVTYFPH
jgi:hypothetical protein